ncbi:hypothetical protein ACH5RR_015367 [Cinchona calisaya]|uniref:DUF1685 domain-containing protein n=1 Tax=Cinchona calisaya TaxID=153742 RepID=A0ABD2ZU69_9GENT
MEAEDAIALFDFCWFSKEIFKKSSNYPTSSTLKKNHDHQFEGNSQKAKFSSQLTIHTRSKSEQLMSMNSGSLSPNSVLSTPQLEKILSGIEGNPESPRKAKGDEQKKNKKRKKNIEAKKCLSKSLSELEFEELKGFMDLGFVFSEEDKKDSSLVEIIPGLQRLGKEKDGEEEESSSVHDESSITRPYLSEAWDVLDRRKKKNPSINWRVPAVSNEIDIKNSLKWWAHIVASTVR